MLFNQIEIIQENINELIDKPTTHTWVEEAEAFQIFRSTIRKVGVICGIMKLKTMRMKIRAVEEQSDELFAMGIQMNARNRKRPLMR